MRIRSDPSGLGNINYSSSPTTFRADVDTAEPKGPTPGSITAETAGTDVVFEELSSPGGMCFIRNLDAENFVTYGLWDGAAFAPLGELLPNEHTVIRLSRQLIAGTYTGTGSPGAGNLRIVADTAPCRVTVEAFDP